MSVATTAPDWHHVAPRHMPTIPLGNEKNSPPVHKIPSALPRYRYWQPNSHSTTWVLVVDLDDSDALLRFYLTQSEHDLPVPSWLIEKGENGHCQAGWIIEHVSHGPTSRLAPQAYARDVRQALTNAFEGDQHFTNGRCWCPWWSGWKTKGRVIWGPTTPRSLGTLHQGLTAAGLWDPSSPTGVRQPTAGPLPDPAEGRNVAVFNAARLRSTGTVADAAHAANGSLSRPLAESEVRGIIRSIERYEAAHGRRTGGGVMSDEQIERQRALGALGGRKRTAQQQQQRAAALSKGPAAAGAVRSAEAVGRAAVVVHWHQQGLTRRQIMAKTGLSEASVKRAIRASRSDPSGD